MDPTEKRRRRITISEEFVALLLDSFDRHLTLKDVLSSFYKDPRFPLVPNLDEIRQVIYSLLQPADHAGPGTGGWELISSDGVSLRVEGPKQLAISSIQQQLRRTKTKKSNSDDPSAGGGSAPEIAADSWAKTGVGDDDTKTAIATGAGTTCVEKENKSDSYSWFRFEITNRSITDETKREAIRNYLVWLASKLDDDTLDHQLITLKYELMVGADSSLANDFRARSDAIKANKAEIEDEI